jgi:hypothetical protein
MGTVSSLLSDHIELRLRCVDRIGVAGYVRDLAYVGLVRFLLHRASLAGGSIPSPVLLAQNHDRMTGDFDRLVAELKLPVVRFSHGDSKELMARPYQLAAATEGRVGVVLVGKAQERMKAWNGHKDSSTLFDTTRRPHFSFTRQSRVPDHWYFYLFDDQWGPAFIKLCSYARVTPLGRQTATFFTPLVTRVVVPTLTDLDSLSRPRRREPTPVAAAWRAYDKEVRAILRQSQLTA